jgi:ATP-dependent Clp protease ATP-binding subunit ClpA
MFHPLMKKQIHGIVELQLIQLRQMLSHRDIGLKVSPEALDWLADEGFDPQYGARPLKRTIQKEVVNRISKMILANEVEKGDTISIDSFNGELTFETLKDSTVTI